MQMRVRVGNLISWLWLELSRSDQLANWVVWGLD